MRLGVRLGPIWVSTGGRRRAKSSGSGPWIALFFLLFIAIAVAIQWPYIFVPIYALLALAGAMVIARNRRVPAGPTPPVAVVEDTEICPRCQATRDVIMTSDGFTCAGCRTHWRTLACPSCDEALALDTADVDSSWRCPSCHTTHGERS